jgi:hypothetical protein
LKKQRWRWAFGNAQILRKNFGKLLFSPSLNAKQRLGFIAHLTAWFSFNLLPSLALILLAFYSTWAELGVTQIYTVLLAGFNLVTYVMLKYGIMHYSLKRDGHRVGEIWKAFASNMGLGWVLSASWLRCFFVSDAPFVRTNKFVSHVTPGALRGTAVELALGVGLLGAALILALTDFVFGPIAAALMCGARLAIYWVWAQTAHTLTATKALFPVPEPEPEIVTGETCAANNPG